MQNQDRAIAQLSSSQRWLRRAGRATAWTSAFTATTTCSPRTCARSSRRKWIVAGHVDRVRQQGRLFSVQDRQGIDHRRTERRSHRQRLLQRVPASRLSDLHRAGGPRGAPHLSLPCLVYGLDGALLERPAHAGGFLEIGQRPAPLSRAGVPRLDFHQPVGAGAGRFRRHIRRPGAVSRFPWIRRRQDRACRVLSDDRQLEARGREFRRVLSLRAVAPGIQLHASAAGARRLRCGPELRAAPRR